MELRELLARRRMTRSFDGTPLETAWLEERCADALWAPTAGNSAGVRMRVVGAEHVGAYFEVATDPSWRESSRRYDGLRRAGGAVLVTTRPRDYLDRYGEPDKATSGLGDRDAWPLPYWHTDAAMATMSLLLLLEESGWQATLWGNFRHAEAVLAWAKLDDEELFATVLIGRSDGNDVPSKSLEREVPARRDRVRRVEP
ncbi:MAG: nitroreductase family protein [Acidimicrobiales bacterium]